MEVYRTHKGEPMIVEVKPNTPNPKATTISVSQPQSANTKTKQTIEKEDKIETKKVDKDYSLDNRSIEFITKKLEEENTKENPNYERIRLIERVLFTRITNLTLDNQKKLLTSSAKKFPSNSPVYKTIRDYTLQSVMDKFVEKKYRQSLHSTPKAVEVSHLEDVHNFVSHLSPDQAEAFRKINEEYKPPLNPNSPEYDYFRETHKGIQATIDNSLRIREQSNDGNIYDGDTGDNLDRNSFAQEYKEQQEENEATEEQTEEETKPIDIYEVTPEQIEIAKELAEEIKTATGDEFLIVDPQGSILDASSQELEESYSSTYSEDDLTQTDYTITPPEESHVYEEDSYTTDSSDLEYTNDGELLVENVDEIEDTDVMVMVYTNTDKQ